MNISEAKQYIKDTVRLYLKKEEDGEYLIPVQNQRPVFLLGAPGIGKTAIMEQVAQELGIAILSYSMTHHTRQSALGLPYIAHKEYEGMTYDVSEYTMSEIIAAIYDLMKETGIKEGILFLDEINCVSETLAPSMLQFLQYKVFGKHQVPEGWVIVTAGNPPEYNRSVREFDVVTLDRLKVLEVEPKYDVWKKYAEQRGMHTAVMNYLEINRDDFYGIETTAKGKNYITARGWEDLSKMIFLYEGENLPVKESLVGQYIHNERAQKEFTAYYDLYQKYKSDYKVAEILAGDAPEETIEKAGKAPFDERISLVGLLLASMMQEIKSVMELSDVLKQSMAPLLACKEKVQGGMNGEELRNMLSMQAEGRKTALENQKKAGSISKDVLKREKEVVMLLQHLYYQSKDASGTGEEVFGKIKMLFDERVALLKQQVGKVGDHLHHLFVFMEKAFGEGNEMMMLLTRLTGSDEASRFITMYGSEDYMKHSKEMMMTDRHEAILEKIKEYTL
ncbi:MAG: AAA family ATPase [Lachnospiraceae bacterium]|nr:AAA family ATPase [Lachnospiraceae bacterium]